MVEVKNINFFRKSTQILKDVSLDMMEGKVTALLGPNGAGKSTLLNIISGELTPESGEVFIKGKEISTWDNIDLARNRAVMPQRSLLTFDFRVLEVVLMGRTPFNNGWDSKEDVKIALKCLKEVDCLHLKDRVFTTLSGGEQQRVSFARVLAQLESDVTNNILLLDEPVSSLDPEHQLKTLILAKKRAEEGRTVFVILHDLNMAATYAEKIAFLDQGELKAFEEPEKVLTPQIIKDVFKIDVDVSINEKTGRLLISNARIAS